MDIRHRFLHDLVETNLVVNKTESVDYTAFMRNEASEGDDIRRG